MPLDLPKFTGPGSTKPRREFFDKLCLWLLSCQKKQGKNVSVDVRNGYGSVINVNPQRQSPSGCTDMCVTFSGITSPCGCVVSAGRGRKIYHLDGLNGTYQLVCSGSNNWDLIIEDGSSCWNVERWLDDCTGPPIDTISGPVHINATFDGSNYLIWIQTEDDAASSAFFASGPGPSITDTHSCGDPTDVGEARGIGGTANISFDPPCDPNPCSGFSAPP